MLQNCTELDRGRNLTEKMFSVVGKFIKLYGIKKFTLTKKSYIR